MHLLTLHHCGWCHPLHRWQLALWPLVVWTTGLCPRCLAREQAKRGR